MPPLLLVRIAIATVLGALGAQPLALDARLLIAVCIVALGVHAARRSEDPRIRMLLLIALVAAFARTALSDRFERHILPTRTMRFEGDILSERNPNGGDVREYIARLGDGTTVLVACVQRARVGAHVVIRGRLEPFDGPRNPDEPSERSIEQARGIDARIASAQMLSIAPSTHRSYSLLLARAHAWALDELRARLGEPAASIVAGELWGERADLPPDLHAEFQTTGTVHILITAGLHVGLVAMLLTVACSALTLPRALTASLSAAGVWGFALWSGADLPALRAATMASFFLAARACGAAALSWNALASAAIVIAWWMPSELATPSCALSFSCVGAIFACAKPIETALEHHASLPRAVREALVLTVATQLGTWPVTASTFLQFSTYAVFANLAVVPCVPTTMLLGALQLLFAWFSPVAQLFANLNGWIIAWITGSVHTLASLPHAAIAMTPPPLWCMFVYDAALLALSPLVRRGMTTLAIALILVATSLALLPPRTVDHRLHVTVLDVGQADAIVIQTPRGHVILVDAGGRLERGASGTDSSAEAIGERIVVPFLLRHGIHAIDAIILSHPHGDHVGGCRPVLRKIRVAEIADGGQTYGGHAYHDCLDTAHAHGVPIVYPRAGAVWRTEDGIILRFIGPSLPFIGGRNAINDNSLAFMLQYRRFRMLFTGDASSTSEQRFLTEGIDLHADVLKVGHHGSAYSSSPTFIAAVHPRYAIISVGRHNLFGHPAPSTIETLRRFAATIYRTDENGAATLSSDGAMVTIATAAQ